MNRTAMSHITTMSPRPTTTRTPMAYASTTLHHPAEGHDLTEEHAQ